MHHEKALARAQAGTRVPVNFAGTWVNELRSEVIFIQNGDALSGTYKSAVSGGGTKTAGHLVGYVDGDLIAFTVHWIEFQAITAWVGQLEPTPGHSMIKTLWQMTNQVDPGDEWASINAGADTFVKQ
jgi:Avidin family